MADKPVEFRFEWDDPLSEVLRRAIAQTDDLSPAMKEIAVHMEGATRRRFETGTDPDGNPWQPSRRSSGSAVGAKGPQRPTAQTLVDSADLKTSNTSRFGPDFAESGPETSFGAAVYALIHQMGMDAVVPVREHKRTITEAFGVRLAKALVVTVPAHTMHMRMPARRYVGFGHSDREPVMDILTRFVASLFGSGSPPAGGEP